MANISLANYHTIKNNKSGGNYSLRNATINGYNEGTDGYTFQRDNLVVLTQNDCYMSNMWAGTSETYYTYPSFTDTSLKFKFDPCNDVTTGTYMGVFDTYDDPSTSFPGLNGLGSSMEAEGVTATPGYTQITSAVGGASAGLEFNGTSQRCRFPTVSSNTSYIANTGNTSCWVAWVYFGELRPGSFKYIWANNQDTTGTLLTYNGAFLQQSSAGDGIIVMLHGDGTGTASSDRRSYVSVANAVSTGWYLVCFQIVGNTTSFNSAGTNRIWTSSASSGNASTTDQISTRTGTGGNLVYNTSRRYCLGQFSNGGYFNGAIGHQWCFSNNISEDEYSSLYDATFTLYE
jgi:hypothetical protein